MASLHAPGVHEQRKMIIGSAFKNQAVRPTGRCMSNARREGGRQTSRTIPASVVSKWPFLASS